MSQQQPLPHRGLDDTPLFKFLLPSVGSNGTPSEEKSRAMKRFTSSIGGLESTIVFRASPGAVPMHEITGFTPGESIKNLTILADEEFNVGEAWYCEDAASGCIYRVDPEYGKAVEFVSSSSGAFRASLEAAVRWSSQHSTADIRAHPELIDELERSLTELDSEGHREYWRLFIEQMRACVRDDDDDLEFKFEAA